MVGKIILMACCWVCAGVFFGFGVYSAHREEPMWFWSGSKVPPGSISDIPAYNRAQSAMWKVYSLPFWAAGAIAFPSPITAAILVAAACVFGIPLLIFAHERIEKRYRK